MSNISGDETPGQKATKILLVEDSFANRDMLTRRLTRRGFTVCSAADGATGVAMSVSELPDLILMDVALGEMDGWQATRLIKADARTQGIPIIALTAHALASDREHSIEVGCADFDTKPVDLSRLLGKIEGSLARAAQTADSNHRDSDALQEHLKGVKSMSKLDPVAALTGSVRDFRELQGTDLMARVGSFYEWQELRRQSSLWPYSRATQEAPLSVCTALDDNGQQFTGLNFGTQDYLALSSHPAIKEVAKAVIDEYGVHSAGSSALAGNTKYSLVLEQTISDFLQLEHTTLYPTGWAAGYGVIKALVRPTDHIVMDGLAHACLQEGAYSATSNVHLHGHLNLESVRRHLRRVRAKDTTNGILVVTESLFSMDSDTPDLRTLQSLCDEYDATLLVDVAHDLGAMGPGGRGFIGGQDMLGKVDIVMGSFSKTFASNGGFVASNSPAVKQYLKYYGCTATFSNALSPVQAATVTKAFDIIKSEEGLRLRTVLRQRIEEMREALTQAGLQHTGNPSPIVPVRVGDEALARLVSRRLPALEVIANLVEYPAVAKGDARLRLQMMPTHSLENVRMLASRLRTAIDHAQIEHVRHRAAITGVTRPVATDTAAAQAA
ncbi:MAG: aminotransferase class I/II-fold pyridoxal phosphate-dependent enzyme [Comamonadaceae bacterium]|nr:aminotransferase class I/II-fold pyridoxal phosphate-dependent enzyme [Pseudomonadota bacterium]MDE2413531.1 aminotransferase class I/II-fold pyridoxal phosphate-dependent enzyme [Comamonadaceae bacterium]